MRHLADVFFFFVLSGAVVAAVDMAWAGLLPGEARVGASPWARVSPLSESDDVTTGVEARASPLPGEAGAAAGPDAKAGPQSGSANVSAGANAKPAPKPEGRGRGQGRTPQMTSEYSRIVRSVENLAMLEAA